MQPHAHPGFLVTLEGPDGSGKSTQAQLLVRSLTAAGYGCVLTREPGGTALGEAVRRILLHSPELRTGSVTDALLFNAARAQLVDEVIAPALERGQVVVCDRFTDSTLAYQGYGAGAPLDRLRAIGELATGGLEPDLTILIDVPVDQGLVRKRGEENRFEQAEDREFHDRVRNGFLALAAADPGRFVVVDGRAPASEVERTIAEAVLPAVAGHSVPRGNAVADPKGSRGRSSEPITSPVRMDS